MEEPWTVAWLSALDELGTSLERKLEISRAILYYNFIVGTPYQACYMLPDMAAGAGAYLSSNLNDTTWEVLENQSIEMMMEETLSQEERRALSVKATDMEAISDFEWQRQHARGQEFIHFYALGVNSNLRGSGAFRKLITPFFDYADAHGLNCYLECYDTHLQGLYEHFGFATVQTFSDPSIEIVEYCMARTPQT